MKPPRGLPAPVKRHFNDLVKRLKDLDHLDAVDVYQIERAAVLIEQGREIQSMMTPGLSVDDLDRLNKMMSTNTSSLNNTLDRLGASYSKRNPYKKQRGRPVKGTKPVDDDAPNDWEKILADVPVATGPRKAN